MKDFLSSIGINIGLSVAGFFGSLLMIGKKSAFNLRMTLTAIIAGTASANYLTPMVVDILRLQGTDYVFSIAFLIGFLGLRLVESAGNRLFKTVE